MFVSMLQQIHIDEYIRLYGENWADSLPEGCPPESVCISGGDEFYRFTILPDRVSAQDWQNHLTLFPERKFDNISFAAGLSVQDNLDNAKRLKCLPYLRKFKGIARISLVETDGVVLQTGRDAHHFTWWRTKMCDLTKAQMI